MTTSWSAGSLSRKIKVCTSVYEDHRRVGAVRSILVVCVDLPLDAPRTSSEEEEDEEEAEAEVEVEEDSQRQ